MGCKFKVSEFVLQTEANRLWPHLVGSITSCAHGSDDLPCQGKNRGDIGGQGCA